MLVRARSSGGLSRCGLRGVVLSVSVLSFGVLSAAAVAQVDRAHQLKHDKGLTTPELPFRSLPNPQAQQLTQPALPVGALGRLMIPGDVQASIGSVAWSPDGRLVAVGDHQSQLALWRADGRFVRTFQPTSVQPEQQHQNQPHQIQGHHGRIQTVLFSPDSRTLITAGLDGKVLFWNIANGTLQSQLPKHRVGIQSAALSPDGRLLATGSRDWLARIWDLSSGKLLQTLQGQEGWVEGIAFLPETSWPSWNAQRPVPDPPPQQQPQSRPSETSQQPPQLQKRAQPSGPSLVVSIAKSSDRPIRLWCLQGEPGPTLPRHGHPNKKLYALAASPTEPLVAVGGEQQVVRLWDIRLQRPVRRLVGHTGEVRALSFSPDGRLLASGSVDNTVRIWEVDTGQQVLCLNGHRSAVLTVAFSPDGRRLASGSVGGNAGLYIWDLGLATMVSSAAERLTDRTPLGLWRTLASDDAEAAYAALWELHARPEAAVQFGRQAAQRREKTDVRAAIDQWITDLGHDDYSRRQTATESLLELLPLAIEPLQAALNQGQSAESRHRIEQLLRIDHFPAVSQPHTRRAVRVLQVLERLGTSDAKEVLQRWADGAPSRRPTRDAWGALRRLATKEAPAPVRPPGPSDSR